MTVLFRFIFLLTVIFCSFFCPNKMPGQILLNPNVNSDPAGTGVAAPFQPGITVGGQSPFSAPSYGVPSRTDTSPLENGTASPPLSPLFGGTKPGTGISLFEQPDSPKRPYLSVPSGSSFRIRPGMTREEIVRAMADEKRMKNIEQAEQQEKMWQEFRVKQEIQKNIRTLFQESDSFRPKHLTKDSADSSLLPPKTSVESQQAKPRPSEVTKKDELSEDERIEREMKAMREALENLADSEQKKKDLEALKRREDTRQRWLTQRAEAERGASLFEVPFSSQLKDQALRDGWCSLFDGKTLFGWRVQEEGPYAGGKFSVFGEMIHSDPQHPGLLYTTAQFGDCTVMFDYQAENDSEAFLLLRTPPNPKNLHTSCYTVVLNSADPSRPRGSILGRQRLNEEQIKHHQARRKDENPEVWHRVKAQFDMTRLQLTIDRDEPINLFDAQPLGYGYLGFLVAKGSVRFRTVLWNPGSKASMFDGISYDQNWRKNGDTLKADVRDSALQLTGGPGVLETKSAFENFVFQCEYNVVYTSGTGSVFFRSLPREAQTGYAVSLQNFPTRKDRDGGIGVDAGAFAGVKNARYIRPQDQKWNYLTVSAVGRQFQTWVNGVPVCEMTDKRPYTEKAGRQGPFPGPGTVQLALTKDNSNIQFRNLRISSLPLRTEQAKTLDDYSKTTWASQKEERKKKEAEQKLDEGK